MTSKAHLKNTLRNLNLLLTQQQKMQKQNEFGLKSVLNLEGLDI